MMSTTTTTPPPPATDPQVAAAREAWIGYGLDPAKFDAAITSQDAPAQSAGGYTSPAPEAPSGGGLSDRAYAQAIADLRAAGVASSAIEAAIKQDGRTVEPDERSPEQVEHARQRGFGTEYDASDYALRYDAAGAKASRNDPQGFLAIDASAREWLAEMNFPPEMAAGFMSDAMAAGRHYASLSPHERAFYQQNERARLARAVGDERAQEYVKLAGEVLNLTGAAAHPFTQILLDHHAFDRAEVLVALAHHAMRVKEWMGTMPGGQR